MIKFFRNIRHRLLSEGKTGKYLKYAIGEIVLVVIGILIALQINNWNENRKQNMRSREYHQRIYEDLDRLTKQGDNLKSNADRVLTSITKAVALLESKKELTREDKKTMDYAMIWFSRTTYQLPALSTYEEMKSNGDLNLIYDVKLRNQITDFYNYLKQVEKVYDKISMAIEDDYKVFSRYIRTYVNPEALSITHDYDFNKMSEDEEFINTFSRLATHWRGYAYFLKIVKQRGDKIQTEFANQTN
ncbi:DUF6090 family protein [Winogradskyella aquimaris]|uniref:DUF6090 family protein n=1 Tax=Winogradskyella aquimaris TaxID=864074 RepID=A0ABU5ERM1_9FLAO|nr:DUF6090 family protein [Winogradskyella aquimaris]MDY2588185.1 DUF6090 family protein [Winogradskyella aquimaris]